MVWKQEGLVRLLNEFNGLPYLFNNKNRLCYFLLSHQATFYNIQNIEKCYFLFIFPREVVFFLLKSQIHFQLTMNSQLFSFFRFKLLMCLISFDHSMDTSWSGCQKKNCLITMTCTRMDRTTLKLDSQSSSREKLLFTFRTKSTRVQMKSVTYLKRNEKMGSFGIEMMFDFWESWRIVVDLRFESVVLNLYISVM